MLDKYDDNNKRKKVVIITGSGKGIGEAIAMEFAKAGYYVMINDFERAFTQLSIYPLPINQYQSLKQRNILSQCRE